MTLKEFGLDTKINQIMDSYSCENLHGNFQTILKGESLSIINVNQ